jgi:hypothetical protein
MSILERTPDTAAMLEVGLAAAVVLLLSGAAALLFGRVAGGVVRGRAEREGPPAPGSVPDERHQHTAAVSAR